MSVNQSSHFRYGAFTNSSLEIFVKKVPVLETIMSSYTQEVFPSTSLDESSLKLKRIVTSTWICVIPILA